MKSDLREILPILPTALLLFVVIIVSMANAYLLGKRHGVAQTNKVWEDAMTIDHPELGKYPKIVPYHAGMTLMPGQIAVGQIGVEAPIAIAPGDEPPQYKH